MIETQEGINPKFLMGVMAPGKPKQTSNDDEEGEEKPATDGKTPMWLSCDVTHAIANGNFP